MPQIFSPRANSVSRLVVYGGIPALVILLGLGISLARSPYATGVGQPVPQPVPFSHKQHVSDLGMDCRYCHNSVETSATAGIPPTATCMTCHSELFRDAEALKPVRESREADEPLRWRRVHDLPDHVYFNHSIHVTRGVACSTCHGRIDRMTQTLKTRPLHMEWCLDCHREPAERLRPRDAVFDVGWQPPADRRAFGRRLMARYGIDAKRLDDCSICHR